MNPARKPLQTSQDNMNPQLQSAEVLAFPSRNAGPSNDLEMLQALESDVATELVLELALLRNAHPEWLAKMEDMAIETASGVEVLELLQSAPNSFAKGLLGGVLRMRLEVAAVTGRSF